ncbi:MAG: type IV pilus modification protein PilV [Nitrosomonas sp.]|uniref:type IV pilus modification protein PilV n=1 Tax=Nitrosomonas sp. TaxID=42353 RepID=UPI0027366897|nr:type IV pilus modification protein PilV [Nitrosomonas sp.]MDP3663431.1 type IV pilus modification protein PilV [Nitrosomonas sp.]MDZ4105769.1 type IV pilus modification protein PilV [Nitrosomonas sp.]
MLMNPGLNSIRSRKQYGFSMLEVLITVLILSFGLLGMASMVTTGMKSNNTSHYRSVATQQSQDIADRMRANLTGVRNGSYNNLATNIPTSSDCAAAACDATQMAVYDHAQWNTANSRVLPGGLGTVAGNLAIGFLITVMWTEKEMGNTSDPRCPVGTPVGTQCFLTQFSP